MEGSAMADVYRAVTLGGSALLGREDLGRLAPGAKADMIAVDLEDFHMGAVDDPIRTIFMGQKYYDKMRMGYMERDYRHLSEDELFRPSFPIHK